MKNGIEKITHLFKQIHEINNQHIDLWSEHVLFTWQWWFGLFLSIIPWVIWFLFRKKDSTLRLLTAGFLMMFIASWLDSIGIQLGLWYYHYEVIPFIPAFIPWDLSLIPVVTMVILQIKPHVSPYIKGAVFGIIASYIAEPFFIWIGLYEPIIWKHIYSLPIFFILYVIAHFLCHGKAYRAL
ncbi:CBO0543 family protein [Alkalihalobacterium elongatum]|uniref:CBO0543 family protein n=1 Tax=Alkalihalobacterium elongatum TaxID=2675466 RepID=UPI001C1F8EAB|nr:CBO0543 family protein [Alkalihalobacterium elongatum]